MTRAPRRSEEVLTPLELEIMQVLWDDGGPATVGEVQARLGSGLAYATVQTMLSVLLTCPGLASPAVVGAWSPVVLTPVGFESLPEELAAAALLHECAHVVRRDYLLNLVCEILTLPLSWHPAAHLLKRRLRAAQEEVCDRLAAAEMGSPARYARCLVELAQRVERAARPAPSAALHLIGRGDLEDRVRELMRPAWGLRRSKPVQAAAATIVAALCLAPVACLHLTPLLGEAGDDREVARVPAFSRAVVAADTLPAAAFAAASSPPASGLFSLRRPALTRSRSLRRLAAAPHARWSRPRASAVEDRLAQRTPSLALAVPAIPPVAPRLVRAEGAGALDGSDLRSIVLVLSRPAACLAPDPHAAPLAADATKSVVAAPSIPATDGTASGAEPAAPEVQAAPAPATSATCVKAAALRPRRAGHLA